MLPPGLVSTSSNKTLVSITNLPNVVSKTPAKRKGGVQRISTWLPRALYKRRPQRGEGDAQREPHSDSAKGRYELNPPPYKHRYIQSDPQK